MSVMPVFLELFDEPLWVVIKFADYPGPGYTQRNFRKVIPVKFRFAIISDGRLGRHYL